ncbi:MAG TPA: serine/threonine-protein kinase [Gemmatimonadales bacterium]|nr:serine/threonine-protein kinase [Gemmatimonadales bacterium]
MPEIPAALKTGLAHRYAIERELGQGGMATVYLAEDLKHHRKVAVKVLKAELAAILGAERFLQEIQVTAQLQHPHIIPLYDSGSADGVLYYVMPLVEGESLRQRLSRDGKLAFEEAVRLIREVASALSYAHEHGIVHRDIKPENILLSGGHAVVADFGVARALSAAQQSVGGQLTGVGIAIGTPAYMSPEQATASEVDARSDQYSLAAVFYEMVTGRAPFSGDTVQAVLRGSLTGPRPKLSRVERAAPPEADGAVARALDSDPARRFPAVSGFAAALEHAAGGGTGSVAERRRLKRIAVLLPGGVALLAVLWILFGPGRGSPVVAGAESIAVLPFSTTGTGVELMGEGMVDLLSTNLNAVGGIHAVDPRLVLSTWKKSGGTGGADLAGALAVARGVKASAALVGSIVASGPRVRVSADLYGQDQKSLAHAQVDGASDSILTLVDELSLSLVREIWRSREPVPSLRVGGLTTTSLAAMREYLEGEQRYRRSEWDSASAAFVRAIDQDSTFALAHYRLAATIGWSGGLGAARGLQASDAALRFAGRLPPREKALVQAYNLFEHQRLAATDSMRAYVARFPDDADGWFLLGESQYHTRQLVGYDPAVLRAPFDSVLARDSTLTPAAIHPLEISVMADDQARYERYLKIIEKSGNAQENLAYRGTGEMAFGDGVTDSTTAYAMLRYGGSMSFFTAPYFSPTMTSDSLLHRFTIWTSFIRHVPETAGQLSLGRGLALSGLGQFRAAKVVFDSLRPINADQAWSILLWPYMVGFAPEGPMPAELQQMGQAPRRSPFQVYVTALLMLNRGERAEAVRLVDSLLASDSTQMPPKLRALVRAEKGWTMVLAGDTAAGLLRMKSGFEDAGAGWNPFLANPLRLQMAVAMTARRDSHEDGLRLLRYAFANDGGILPISQYALGRAEEAAGNRAAAAEAFGRFLRWWDQADSSAQPRVKEARETLARLTAEPR